MANRRTKSYWDACVFLAIVNAEEGRVDHCVGLFEEAEKEKKAHIYTSALTIAECGDAEGTEETDEQIRRFFESAALTVINVDRLIAERARELQRVIYKDTGQKLPVRDSIHLAAALHVDAAALLTYDRKDLISLNGRFSNGDGTHLVITEPFWQRQPQMPLAES